jgi:OFA family oxalate/formate antiporter-like MFS transporter
MTAGRWKQLFIGVVCMVMVANLQYSWTLFVEPINHKFGWGRPAIQVAFSIFVLCEAWLVPLEGWFVDRFGPRRVLMAGAVLIALAWIVVTAQLAPVASEFRVADTPVSLLVLPYRPSPSRS